MKTKSLSNNRVTRSHPARKSESAQPCNRVSPAASNTIGNTSVSNRESGAISRQVCQIRESWSQAERDERAQLGAQRRAELCQLLFGAN